MKKYFLYLLVILFSKNMFAQNVGIGVPAPSQKLEVNGAIKVGTTTTNEPGTIRYNGNTFEGGDGTNWKGLEALPSGTIVLSETFPNNHLSNIGYSHVGHTDGASSKKDSTNFQQSNSWRSISNNGAPAFLTGYSSITANDNLFMFGGYQNGVLSNQGYIYNKSNDTWEVLNKLNAPTPRYNNIGMLHTNAEVIVIGGDGYGIPTNFYGAKYRLSTKVWSPISSVNAPSPRSGFKLVWTGTRMLFWGGLASGGIYNPINNTWLPMSTLNAPSARKNFQSFWTGTEWIIWGGVNGFPEVEYTDGAKYNPTTDTWTPISMVNAPLNRIANGIGTAIWTGAEMIIWGGKDSGGTGIQTGARYNPTTNSWATMTTTNAPAVRYYSNTAWTGSQLLVWGGSYFSALQSGARYDPILNTWTIMPTLNAPPARQNYQSVYNGSLFIIWGGVDLVIDPIYGAIEKENNAGYFYSTVTNSWSAFSLRGAPKPRQNSSSSSLVFYWAGDRLIVWGGGIFDVTQPTYFEDLYDGGRYFITAPTGTTYFDAGPKRFYLYQKN